MKLLRREPPMIRADGGGSDPSERVEDPERVTDERDDANEYADWREAAMTNAEHAETDHTALFRPHH
jgi:hypothetical protein